METKQNSRILSLRCITAKITPGSLEFQMVKEVKICFKKTDQQEKHFMEERRNLVYIVEWQSKSAGWEKEDLDAEPRIP